ncbi:MAG: hypothetical protein ACFFDN_14010 [Candidatus Hodarchaeota archaeon]
MKKIYKYQIPFEDVFTMFLPIGAKILMVGDQNDKAYLWALVNPNNDTEDRYFRLAGTGHPIEHKDENLKYINSFMQLGGRLVWHLFEIIETK